ncbi:MAG: hypothetical protein DLM70_03160 [Chloroflexi bacterium]|nr:MAG: hypothetical protein DLM70_03160 [Chloroflexota bacterium]
MNATEERLDIGADVIGSAGDKVGTVAYAVINPPELHMTDFVVSTGHLLGRDVVVPVNKVDRLEDGKVYLSIDKDELEKLPDYVEVHFQQPPAAWAPAPGFLYPAQSVLWPADAYYPDPASVTVNAPKGSVGISQGMEVESSDGHKIGTVKGLDAGEGDVTDLIVKEGFLFTHDVHIAADLVDRVDDGRVILKVSKDEVASRALES